MPVIGFEALKATVTIAPAKRWALLAQSGSGKTTLASAVMRLVASQGEVILATPR